MRFKLTRVNIAEGYNPTLYAPLEVVGWVLVTRSGVSLVNMLVYTTSHYSIAHSLRTSNLIHVENSCGLSSAFRILAGRMTFLTEFPLGLQQISYRIPV